MSAELERAAELLASAPDSTLWTQQAAVLAVIALAAATERLADAAEIQAAISRHYFEENEGELDLRPTATVRSPLLMDVPEGTDEGQWLEVKFWVQGARPRPPSQVEHENLIAAAYRLAGEILQPADRYLIDGLSVKAAER